MKFTIFLAVALAGLIPEAHALDKAKYLPIAQEMMEFPDHPTEAGFRDIEAKLAALPELDLKSAEDQHVILIGAAFLVSGHDRHHWAIAKDSQIGEAASEIIAGKGEVAAWVRNDKAVNDSKFDYWWMAYLGSQDEAYLFKILKYAGDPTPYKDERKIWVSLASWSFKSNCQQIKAVREFVERHLDDPALKDRRKFLASCLE